MSVMKKLGKSGMFGLAGLAASEKGMVDKIARNGGLGVMGMMAAKKNKAGAPNAGMRGRPMVEDIMVAEEAPAMGGRFGTSDRGENTKQFKKGGKVKKMAKGGSASKRADGCATKGKTKGKFV